MLSEGATAPGFELPALVDGEKRRVALAEYLGDDVVILAFYPADFNPACDEESCDLDELDLFTMQKDVTILGISPDSVYSHRAFAERYDLKVPLLADTDGEVAERYDIDFVDDIGQQLLERAVAVVDHDGTVQYSWSTDDMTELPRVEELKDALAETGGDDTAFARYRVGHAHYTEGRRAFTSAMDRFRETEWMMAQHDFQQAREEFEEAADQFDTAVRFVDDESLAPVYEDSNEKATALWQAADWLVRSASAYSSGSGTEGQQLRDDAEMPLATVREYIEPPDPDDEWPPDVTDLEKDDADDHSVLPTETEVEDAALAVDIDEEMADTDEAVDSETADGDLSGGEVELDGLDGEAVDDDIDDDAAVDDDIDDEELAEIQAELAANHPESEPTVEEVTEEPTAIVDAPPMGEDPDGTADEPADATPQVRGDQSDGEPDEESGRDDDTGLDMPGDPAETDAEDGVMETDVEDGATETDAEDGATVTDSEEGEESTAPSAFELAEPDPDPLGPEVTAGGDGAGPRDDGRPGDDDEPAAGAAEGSTAEGEDDGTLELHDSRGESTADE
ncbi:redoxin domain-containing protein [Haloarcula sp. S1CR25-12]|uniref:Redoxin domain-containing protein n=1 Tax=Haloarcula saliterrae TaxID=2950534 RepID=A0ABU2FDV0_9EURY|nr:redoxin domain-containing protein [Haloarcula sp. S1CR25-12]MDS0260392.1 redoxin domain-containing protein [Haloarcula sp. S1CR25-12]